MNSEASLENLKFPIGRWQRPEGVSAADLQTYQATLAAFPAQIRAQVAHLSDEVLNTPYRPEGWTVRQVVHHCADSHTNALIRFKLALTEEKPTIRPYKENLWAQLPDYHLPVESSLRIIDAVHERLVFVLQQMRPEDWAREYVHPEYGVVFRLDQVAALYAWHCRHHMGHIGLVISGK
jgi:hypothetical protein